MSKSILPLYCKYGESGKIVMVFSFLSWLWGDCGMQAGVVRGGMEGVREKVSAEGGASAPLKT